MSAKNVNEWLDKSHPIDYDDQQQQPDTKRQSWRACCRGTVGTYEWICGVSNAKCKVCETFNVDRDNWIILVSFIT